MSGPLDFLNPIKGLAGAAEGIIDQFVDSPEEKAEAERLLAQEQRKAEAQLFSARAKIVEEQSKTIRAEVASDHWLAANWRPVLMLTFGFVVLYSVVAPAFGAPPVDLSGIPERFWTLVTVGVGGYVAGRSAEKIIPNSRWGPQSSDIDEITNEVVNRIADANS